jgi:hypothetical protein
VVGVAYVASHRQAEQFAAEMIFEAGANDLLSAKKILWPDDANHGIDQQCEVLALRRALGFEFWLQQMGIVDQAGRHELCAKKSRPSVLLDDH